MSMISPYKDTDEEITTEVLLAESVIIGKIPETFYNLDGVTKDDAIMLTTLLPNKIDEIDHS